uniref:RRM domain-containing protein n=1 Tax=Alexandrium catenella TaxID=2925 RepID=A0A7S1Q0T3_ALECA
MPFWQQPGQGSPGSQSIHASCSSSVLRLRGVPHEQNNEGCLFRFFKGYSVLKVLPSAGMDRDGRPRGEAYVEFSELSEASRALNSMQYAMMGTRYIELFNSTPEEMTMAEKEKTLLRASADLPATTTVLRMRGLPFKATAADICRFFDGFRVHAVLPLVLSPADGRPRGEAFAEFATVEDCGSALKAKQHASMQQRYVELFPSTTEEMARAAEETSAQVVDAAAIASGAPTAGCGAAASSSSSRAGSESARVFVGALPRTATEEGIRAHFSTFGKVEQVVMHYTEEGGFKGYCFVVFAEQCSADSVLSNYDNNSFDGQWIACKPASPVNESSNGSTTGKGKHAGADGKGSRAGDKGDGGSSGWGSNWSGWGNSHDAGAASAAWKGGCMRGDGPKGKGKMGKESKGKGGKAMKGSKNWMGKASSASGSKGKDAPWWESAWGPMQAWDADWSSFWGPGDSWRGAWDERTRPY